MVDVEFSYKDQVEKIPVPQHGPAHGITFQEIHRHVKTKVMTDEFFLEIFDEESGAWIRMRDEVFVTKGKVRAVDVGVSCVCSDGQKISDRAQLPQLLASIMITVN